MARILLATGKSKIEIQTIKKQLQQKATLEELIIMYPEFIKAIAKYPLSPALAALVAQDEKNKLGEIPRGATQGIKEVLEPIFF